MLIVGELINASRKSVREIIEKRDAEGIAKLARDQRDHGANYIDVNAGVFVGREPELLKWLVATVQNAVEVPCCIDSPDPKAIAAALAVHKGTAMINSISLEKERYDTLLPLVAESKSKVVALCMSDEGMPETADQRMAIADQLVNGLVKNGVPPRTSTWTRWSSPWPRTMPSVFEFLQAIERITQTFKGVHTMCGLVEHLLRPARTQVHQPDLHGDGHRQGAGRRHRQPARCAHDGLHHHRRNADGPRSLLHELFEGVPGRQAGGFLKTGVSGRDPALRGLLRMLTCWSVCCASQISNFRHCTYGRYTGIT